MLPPCPTAQVRDLAGDLVLDLTPDDGYDWLGRTGTGGAVWRRNETESPYVDGATEVTQAVLAAQRRIERFRVGGDESLTGDDYWVSVEDRLDALEQAVSRRFLWVVSLGGYVWTYRTIGPADLDAADVQRLDGYAGRRMVALSFTVQPNPTKVAL